MPRDLRLLPVLGAAWGAALIGVGVPSAAAWIGWCCLGACVAAVIVLLRRGGRRSRAGLLVVVLATAAGVSLSVLGVQDARAQLAEADGRVVEVRAVVSSSASVGVDGRLWFDADVEAIGPPGRVARGSGPVRIGAAPGGGFDLGATVTATGEASSTAAGERAALVLFSSDATVTVPSPGVFAIASDLRTAFIERASHLPAPGAGLLPGLAVGDTRAVPPELSEQMKVSGLSHLTAVSGANCALVVGAVFWLVALCGGGRTLRVLLAAGALACFVILVTPEPSVVRASVMAGAAMLSILVGRPSAGAGMLAVSATGILIVDPWLSATAGFALSVAASGALILLAPLLAGGIARWTPQPLAVAIAVPTSAQLVCGPIIALFSDQQSLVGIAANLLAAPAAPLATVIGMLACLAAPVPPLADVLAASAWLPSPWIAATARVTAEMPAAPVELAAGWGSALQVALVSAAAAVTLIGSVRVRAVRLVAAGVVICLLSWGGGQAVVAGPLASATSPEGWSIAACDVGQGDAVLVRSDDRVALIDTGPEPRPLADCLRSLGIDRIDLLVLTHFDLDHVGGVDAVVGRVTSVVHGPEADAGDGAIIRRLGDGGARTALASSGMRGELGRASWRILWPPDGTETFEPGNDLSAVLEVDGGGVPRSLFLGDLSAEAQRVLMRDARFSQPFDVVKVAHHGSADQDPGLYDVLRPRIALISVGADNDYGHPRDEILDTLRRIGSHVLRTDERGRVLLGARGDELEVWTGR